MDKTTREKALKSARFFLLKVRGSLLACNVSGAIATLQYTVIPIVAGVAGSRWDDQVEVSQRALEANLNLANASAFDLELLGEGLRPIGVEFNWDALDSAERDLSDDATQQQLLSAISLLGAVVIGVIRRRDNTKERLTATPALDRDLAWLSADES